MRPEWDMDRTTWTLESGGKNYSIRLRHNATDVALSFGSKNAHIYVELAGKACDAYESVDALVPLVSSTCERSSRLDVATDFETNVTPEQFSAFRNTDKWKYAPYYPSESGTTCYVGSRKSERMARVYRYNPPHPRSHLLRVETEYKGKAAKALAALVVKTPISALALRSNAIFGWSHPLWDEMGGIGETVKYKSYRPQNAATVRWLYGDVSKAIRKGIANGYLEWDEFVAHVFKKENRDKPEE
jgi:DNA relaxase NicK